MEPETLKLIIPIMALLIPFFAIWTKHQRKMEEIPLPLSMKPTRRPPSAPLRSDAIEHRRN